MDTKEYIEEKNSNTTKYITKEKLDEAENFLQKFFTLDTVKQNQEAKKARLNCNKILDYYEHVAFSKEKLNEHAINYFKILELNSPDIKDIKEKILEFHKDYCNELKLNEALDYLKAKEGGDNKKKREKEKENQDHLYKQVNQKK